MIVRDSATGRYKIVLSHEEFMGMYRRWQQKPETQEMFAKIAAEREARIAKILADMKARKNK